MITRICIEPFLTELSVKQKATLFNQIRIYIEERLKLSTKEILLVTSEDLQEVGLILEDNTRVYPAHNALLEESLEKVKSFLADPASSDFDILFVDNYFSTNIPAEFLAVNRKVSFALSDNDTIISNETRAVMINSERAQTHAERLSFIDKLLTHPSEDTPNFDGQVTLLFNKVSSLVNRLKSLREHVDKEASFTMHHNIVREILTSLIFAEYRLARDLGINIDLDLTVNLMGRYSELTRTQKEYDTAVELFQATEMEFETVNIQLDPTNEDSVVRVFYQTDPDCKEDPKWRRRLTPPHAYHPNLNESALLKPISEIIAKFKPQ